uniref:Ig-like domain-containing protein n=1 Tax=Seriola lalandi dorsalis TaxID=1841481 RepID=A0A3B4WLS2_SERLL
MIDESPVSSPLGKLNVCIINIILCFIPGYGVLQVTWQRLFKDNSIENLATYSERFGQQVNGPYLGKVIFTEATLSSTSITLNNVSWQDESCYICSFNVYPDGSKTKKTCLKVQGRLKGGTEGENKEVEFSCSATGKPAPTIEWVISPEATHSDQPPTTTVTNSDHTFTSSRNITLRVPPDWNGQVDCLLNNGMRGQRQERIPFDLGSQNKEKDGMFISHFVFTVLVACVVMQL